MANNGVPARTRHVPYAAMGLMISTRSWLAPAKVLEATRAISVSCEGRLPGQDSGFTCVDLFLFLRILLHSFKEEQVS